MLNHPWLLARESSQAQLILHKPPRNRVSFSDLFKSLANLCGFFRRKGVIDIHMVFGFDENPVTLFFKLDKIALAQFHSVEELARNHDLAAVADAAYAFL